MILNFIYFTDFYFIDIVLLYFDFFQRLSFHPLPHLKLTLFRLQNYHEYSRFLLCDELHRFVDITWTLRISKFKPNTKNFRKSPWLIHFDGFFKQLYSFQKLVAASFFININCNFPDQGKIGHHTSIFTKTNVHLCAFFAQRHLLFKSS